MPAKPGFAGWHRGRGDETHSATGDVLEALVPGEVTFTASRQLHISQAGDHDSDWGLAAQTDPMLVLHSTTTPTTDYATWAHDGSNLTNDVAGGSYAWQVAGTTEMSLSATVFDLAGVNLQVQTSAEILDNNANQLISFPAAVASAIENIRVNNAAAGNNASITSVTSATNSGLTLDTSGTGQIRFDLGGAVALTLDDSAVTVSGAVHPAFLGSLAGTGNSIAGSNFSLSTGAASNASSSGAGDVGGTFDITLGAGSNGCTTGAGGAGGPFTLTTGAGGTALGCAAGGASGAITMATGLGGANSAGACSVGGASGLVSITTGVGAASNAASCAGGASGNVTVGTGRGGSGATGESGAGGTLRLQVGRAGACGSALNGRLEVLNDTGGLGITSVAQSSCAYTSPNLGVGNVFVVTGWVAGTVSAACTGVLIIETA